MRLEQWLLVGTFSLAQVGCFSPNEVPPGTGSSTGEVGSSGLAFSESSTPSTTLSEDSPEGSESGVTPSTEGSESGEPLTASCGDGIVQDWEACDDGNNDGSYGGCSPNCEYLASFCGDGLLDNEFESCDDGNRDEGDGCNNNCRESGDILWSTVVPIDDDIEVRGLALLPDQSIIVVGQSGFPDSFAWAVALEPNGDLRWEETYSGDFESGFMSVAHLGGNQVFATGFADTADADDAPNGWVAFLETTSGSLVNERFLPESLYVESAVPLDETNLFATIMFGLEGTELATFDATTLNDGWSVPEDEGYPLHQLSAAGTNLEAFGVLRADASGVAWTQTLSPEGEPQDEPDTVAVAQAVPGTVLVHEGGAYFGGSPERDKFWWLISTNLTGEVDWQVRDPGGVLESMALDSHGRLVAVGGYRENVGDTFSAPAIWKYDPDGGVVWSYTRPREVSTIDQNLRELAFAADGSIIAAGEFAQAGLETRELLVMAFEP